MSQYCQISAQEMRDYLKVSKGWVESTEGNELVFSYPLKKYSCIWIKVFSGITLNNQTSRDCGKDAIRVCAIINRNNKIFGWIKSNRVYRVMGWKRNLFQRVLETIQEAETRAWKERIQSN